MPLLLLSSKNTYITNNNCTSQSEDSAWSRPQRLAQKPELHRWLLCSAANLALTSALLHWLLIVCKPLIVPNFFSLIYFMAVFSVVFLITLSPEQFNNCFIVLNFNQIRKSSQIFLTKLYSVLCSHSQDTALKETQPPLKIYLKRIPLVYFNFLTVISF